MYCIGYLALKPKETSIFIQMVGKKKKKRPKPIKPFGNNEISERLFIPVQNKAQKNLKQTDLTI